MWLDQLLGKINRSTDIIIEQFAYGVANFTKYAVRRVVRDIHSHLYQSMACLKNQLTLEAVRNQFHLDHGDGRLRYHHLSFAQPIELKNVQPFQANGTFVQEYIKTGLHIVKNAHIVYNDSVHLLHLIGAKQDYLVTNNDSSSPLYFDEWSDTVHFDSPSPRSQGLNYSITDGVTFTQVYGSQYQVVHDKQQNKTAILTHRHDGRRYLIDIYLEPISKSWHLSTYNRYPVFNHQQRKILERITLNPETYDWYIAYKNNNSRDYGSGLLYYAKKKDAVDQYGPFIEINGKLAAVKASRLSKQIIHYAIYKFDTDYKIASYPIEWDGRRWVFERETAPQVSHQLTQYITADKFERHVDILTLSAANEFGLRSNHKGHTFLKMWHRYVRLHRVDISHPRVNYCYFVITATPGHPRLNLRFKDNSFFVENLEERLHRLVMMPFNHTNTTTIDRLKEQPWLNKKRARRLLASYRLPKEGFFGTDGFAIDIEQTGQIPLWAMAFKKNSIPLSIAAHIGEQLSVTVTSPNPGAEKRVLRLIPQPQSSDSELGQLFLDSDDPRYLVKKYFDYSFGNPHPMQSDFAREEARRLQRYFGPEAGQVFYDNHHQGYLRFYFIPGKALQKYGPSLPKTASERLLDMLEKMMILGIHFGDLSVNDLVWDEESSSFYPLNIHRINAGYYFTGRLNELKTKGISDQQILYMLEQIRSKMVL